MKNFKKIIVKKSKFLKALKNIYIYFIFTKQP